MDFYLNIGTITKTIIDYLNTYQTLEERERSRNLSISELTELGWSGEARDKFLEAHEEKIKLYEKLKEDIKYMISALEEEKQRALLLKTRCEDFINCIERNGQGGAITGDDEGVISLDYSSQTKINNYVNNCTNEDYVKLNSNFRRIEDILSELEYTSFGISGEVGSAKTSVKDQTESLTEFDHSFNVYYAGVKDMESNICSVFGKISASSDSPFKNSSVIAPNGELDKNILTNAVLKNQNGFTIETLGTNTNITNGMNLENMSEVKKEGQDVAISGFSSIGNAAGMVLASAISNIDFKGIVEKILSDINANNSKLYKHERDVLSQVTEINSKFDSDINNYIEVYEKNKDMYERISKETDIPSELVWAIHCRESNCNFKTYLHNGDPLGADTVNVPVGIHFNEFEPAAIDAINREKYKLKVYSIDMNSDTTDMNAMCALGEVYNGTGYYTNERPNPYILSGTNLYEKGKYPSDGHYDPNLVDAQPGVYELITKLREKEGQ